MVRSLLKMIAVENLKRFPGKSMEGPGYLIKKAVVNGINHGRGGLGSIYVFASGNGAAHGDQCNFDGYTNSIYSVTVSSVDYKGLHPYYSEPCAANMIVAYSSGSGRSIVRLSRFLSCSPQISSQGYDGQGRERVCNHTWRDIRCCSKRCRCVRSRVRGQVRAGRTVLHENQHVFTGPI